MNISSSEIPVPMTKLNKNTISPHLVNPQDHCMLFGVFSNDLKLAKAIPTRKFDDKNNPSNYRPNSLLSHLSNIFENLVYHNLTAFYWKTCYFVQNSMDDTIIF